eukprot:1759047-Pleurochrysis_carterae.AAC.1
METLAPEPAGTSDDEITAGAQIGLHHFFNGCFLPEAGALPELIAARDRLAAVPCAIVHGRHDCICPPATAWRLQRAWPRSSLRIVERAAHALFEKPMRTAAAAALAQLVTELTDAASTRGKRKSRS